MNATIDHHKAFLEVQERWNISMHSYEDVPWEHLTPEECKMQAQFKKTKMKYDNRGDLKYINSTCLNYINYALVVSISTNFLSCYCINCTCLNCINKILKSEVYQLYMSEQYQQNFEVGSISTDVSALYQLKFQVVSVSTACLNNINYFSEL